MKSMAAVKEIMSTFKPEIGLVLGSGLGPYADRLEQELVIPYSEIEGFPTSHVAGHQNRFLLATLKGRRLLVMQGRFHYYEGLAQGLSKLPIYLMKEAGVHSLILTNAAGGVNENFKPGDLMLIKDHINASGSNPLIGANDEAYGPRFPDLSEVYNKKYRTELKKLAVEAGLYLQEGVYVMTSGPSYETPAEVQMFRLLGGDAVGMSTVPEAIVAAHAGLKVLGISCITNMAAGILPEPLNHQDVVAVAAKAADRTERLLELAICSVLAAR